MKGLEIKKKLEDNGYKREELVEVFSSLFVKKLLKGINMEEVIIKFLDITTIKFIGTPELIELVKNIILA